MYRFRKILERPDWQPPQCVTIEVKYDASNVSLAYDDDSSSGGVTEIDWIVVAVKGPIGVYHQPNAFHVAELLLSKEAWLLDEIRDACYEDFAARNPLE